MWAAALTSVSHSVRNSILDLASTERQQSNSNVTISVDGRWSSRRQARILGIVHLFENQDLDWRKGLFAHLGLQMVEHLCGTHQSCPKLTQQGKGDKHEASVNGYTIYQDACIVLNWHCRVEVDALAQSKDLAPAGEKKSRGWKYRVIRCEKTKDWLKSFVHNQASRDEIMWYGSSNINESFHNAITVKASKQLDFRCVRKFISRDDRPC